MNKHKKLNLFFILLVLTLLLSSFAMAERGGPKSNNACNTPAFESERGCESSTTTNHGRLIAESASNGKIEWDNDLTSNLSSSKLLYGSSFEHNKITVYSDDYPELNIPARIYFYDTGLSGSVAIFEDGYFCSTCKPVLYGDDDYYLDVNHFSSWTINETSFNGTFLNTVIEGDGITKSPLAGFIWSGENNNFIDESYYNLTEINTTGSDVQILSNDGSNFGNYYLNFSESAYLEYNGPNIIRADTDKNMTFMLRFANSTKPAKSSRFFSKDNEYTHGAGNANMYLNTWGGSYIITGSSFDITEWQTHTVVWYPGLNITGYNDGTLFGSTSAPDTSNPTGTNLILGVVGVLSNAFDGQVDSIYILPTALDQTQIAYLSNNYIIPKYYQYGNYTSEIINVNDYDTEVYSNVWESVNITVDSGASNQIEVYGRAGTCGTVESQGWTLATKSGTDFKFGAGLSGDCFQHRLEFGGDYNYTDVVLNINQTAFKVVTPSLTNVSISPSPTATASDTITGNATYLLNDTDTGSILFEWFVNGVNQHNETVSSLVNGSNAGSTLSPIYTSVGDVIYFNATAINTVPFSSTTTSSGSTTIQNSGFTLISWTTGNGTTLNMTEPETYNFFVNFTDIDGDVNTTWYVDGEVYATGTEMVFRSEYSMQGSHTIQAIMTDGTNTESLTWTMAVTNTDTLGWTLPLMLGLISLVVLYGGLLMFLDKIHVVVRLVCFLMLPFTLVALTAFMVKVAQISGMDSVTVLFSGLFKTMIALTTLSVAYVILFFIVAILNSIKERKEKKERELVQ